MISTVLVFIAIGCSVVSVASIDSDRRVKKIANGEVIPSLSTYRTYFYTQLRHTWACTSDQLSSLESHDDALVRCEEDILRCSGALINPEFVLTAASCVMYYEVIIKDTDVDEINRQKDKGFDVYSFFEKITGRIVGYVVKPKPKHTIYSDWTLLVGSNDLFKMTQKRHVVNVFPHRVFPKDRSTANLERLFQLTRSSWHDVALLQACLPFTIKKREVELAPMLGTLQELRDQYERIVRMGSVCLFIGFGKQENSGTTKDEQGLPYFRQNLMLHAWRSTKCYSDCSFDKLGYLEEPHTCHLCSWQHGPKLGVGESGDTGGPVTCEGYFVATITQVNLELQRNHTRTDSYPLHCIKKSISDSRLEYYKSLPYEKYHPLVGTKLRHRRFPLHPD